MRTDKQIILRAASIAGLAARCGVQPGTLELVERTGVVVGRCLFAPNGRLIGGTDGLDDDGRPVAIEHPRGYVAAIRRAVVARSRGGLRSVA